MPGYTENFKVEYRPDFAAVQILEAVHDRL
jgi:hypothetical protein